MSGLQDSVPAAEVACLARRARAELSRIFARIIQARRGSAAREEDILQCFIDSRYEKVALLMRGSSLSIAVPCRSAVACALCWQS